MSTQTESQKTAAAQIDEAKLHDFVIKMVTELGAAATGALVLVGERLGLYRALSEIGPCSPETLAKATGTNPRLVQEWLSNQAASGYLEYDSENELFSLTPEQSMVLADPDSPVLLTGGYYAIASLYADEEKVAESFKNNEGIEWGDHDSCLFCGTEKFFRPSYKAHLIQDWLPALEGVEDKLSAGAKVADVGCGFGASTLVMAERYPDSEFIGYDYHEPSIVQARKLAAESGLSNVSFEVAKAKEFGGQDYDLVTMFDCLHDMGDPAGAAAHVRRALKEDGTMMVVEPMAGNDLSENLNPVGRVYYAFSTTVCTPSSLSQEVQAALGAQAGESRLTGVLESGGFQKVRRAAETPFNMVLEARN